MAGLVGVDQKKFLDEKEEPLFYTILCGILTGVIIWEVTLILFLL